MGALFSSPSIPSVPVVPPAPPGAAPATLANPNVAMSGANQRAAAAAAAGAGVSGTITNQGGQQGLVPGSGQTASRSLLG